MEDQREKHRTGVLCSDPCKIKLKLGKKNKRAYKLFVVFILG
jgi:predicted nucleic acid-binding Zn ribbon protein